MSKTSCLLVALVEVVEPAFVRIGGVVRIRVKWSRGGEETQHHAARWQYATAEITPEKTTAARRGLALKKGDVVHLRGEPVIERYRKRNGEMGESLVIDVCSLDGS